MASAIAVSVAEISTPVVPPTNKNGISGMIAPTANIPNDDAAAPTGEPSPSCGSMPSSSRACVSRATSGSFMTSSATWRASSSDRPLRR